MKKGIVICALLVFLSVASNVYAHPPTDIRITFDSKTKMLKAVIEHNTKNFTNHYIKTAEVKLNGKKIISHTISRQDNHNTQTVYYLIPDVKNGDVLAVEGYCNMFGNQTKKITVKI